MRAQTEASLKGADAALFVIDARAGLTPLRRCVTADDVAKTVVSLITSNPFVTGEIVVIDGGFSATT